MPSSATMSPYFGHDERVDLAERAVFARRRPRRARPASFTNFASVSLSRRDRGRTRARAPGRPRGRRRIDVHRDDLLGRLGGDLLDLDAALGRRHEGDAPAVAVDDGAEVELARDVETLLDVEAAHLLPLGARLVGDELHAEDLLGELPRLGGAALGDLDAAAFAAAAGVDLRLDDDDGAARLLRRASSRRPRPRRRSTPRGRVGIGTP